MRRQWANFAVQVPWLVYPEQYKETADFTATRALRPMLRCKDLPVKYYPRWVSGPDAGLEILQANRGLSLQA